MQLIVWGRQTLNVHNPHVRLCRTHLLRDLIIPARMPVFSLLMISQHFQSLLMYASHHLHPPASSKGSLYFTPSYLATELSSGTIHFYQKFIHFVTFRDFSMDSGACELRSQCRGFPHCLVPLSLHAPEQLTTSSPYLTQDCVPHTQANSTSSSPFLREIVSSLLDKDTQK